MINEDNVIINTPEKELETEPQNIPQGEKPFINPNPGYGEDGETKPAIKTVIFPGERGIRSEVVTPLQEGVKVERNLVNFLKGLLVKGKPLEEYIDSQGGVTEEELQAALTPIRAQLGNIDTTKLIHKDFSVFSKIENNELELSDVIDVLNKSFTDDYETVWYPLFTADYNGWFAFLGNDFQYILYELDDFDEPTAFSDISCHVIEIKSIVPNPTLAGTESALTGLQVGNTKYAVLNVNNLGRFKVDLNVLIVGDVNEDTYNFGSITVFTNNPIDMSSITEEDVYEAIKDKRLVMYNGSSNALTIGGLQKLAPSTWNIEDYVAGLSQNVVYLDTINAIFTDLLTGESYELDI